jgi:hypothetical protein
LIFRHSLKKKVFGCNLSPPCVRIAFITLKHLDILTSFGIFKTWKQKIKEPNIDFKDILKDLMDSGKL